MKRIDLILLVVLCVFNVCCEPESDHSVDAVAAQESGFIPEGYQLSFSDEFTSLELDTDGDGSSTWAPWFVDWGVHYLEGNDDHAWKCHESFIGPDGNQLNETMHDITGAETLRLYGYPTPETKRGIVNDFPFIAGMISANKSFSQTYGYWEIKCRFEATKGHHWALWLLPTDNSWPPEIDIVEYVGHAPDEYYMTGHWDDGEGHESNFQTFTGADLRQWNIFGFEWTPEEMIWYLNGQEKKRMANFVDKPMYFLMTPEIGSRWTGEPDETTVWPMVGEVDYIRVYK